MAVWPAGKHFQCLSTPWLAQAGLAQRPGKGPLEASKGVLEGRLGRPEVPLKNLYIPCVSTPP